MQNCFSTLFRNLLYRKPSCSHVLCFTFFAVALAIPQQNTFGQQLTREVARFVGEVAIDSEFTQDRHVTVRWAKPARLSVFNANRDQTDAVNDAVRKINEALEDTFMEIEIVQPEDDQASMIVIYAPLDQFEELADKYGMSYVSNNFGIFFTWWDRNFEIERAVILLASDKLRGNRLKHFALEEITQSLGLIGDSPRFEDSVFFEKPDERKYGTARSFSRVDANLLKFMYTRVAAGTHAVELGMLLAQHWDRDF